MTNFIEVPASKKSLSLRKPLYGVGINDVIYITNQEVDGKQSTCHYYRTWKNMLRRSYCHKYHAMKPTYLNCSVVKEWLTFSVFKEWMKDQDWQSKQLDKDIIMPGNKEYGPIACVFVSSAINKLLSDHAAARGALPQGVCFNKPMGKYQARCSINGKNQHLGYFASIPEAEIEYLEFKSSLIKKVAFEPEAVSNPKLQAALIRHSEAFKQKLDDLTQQTKQLTP